MKHVSIGIGAGVAVFFILAILGLSAVIVAMPDPPNVHRTYIYDITVPNDWVCRQEGTEAICRPDTSPPYRAVMIASLKFKNPAYDTLDAYEKHLSKSMSIRAESGGKIVSTIERVGRTEIDGRSWVDGVHLNSEILNYRTRYLATTTAQVAVLITFSSRIDEFDGYQPLFEKAVRSINIYQRQPLEN